MKLTQSESTFFHDQVTPLLMLSDIQKMNQFIQHGHTSCLEHCLTVAYYSYLIAKRLNLDIDESSLIRGCLLHDFFLYDWHDKSGHHSLHGFKHPKTALKNANRCFHLTAIEKDMISHHMWPLTPIPPHSKEAFILCLIDKWCSLRETIHKPSKLNALLNYTPSYITS